MKQISRAHVVYLLPLIVTLTLNHATSARADFWTNTASMNVPRVAHVATYLQNGKVLVTGGYSVTTVTNSAEIYDPTTGTWGITGSLNTNRWYHTATLLPNGTVLVAGGFGKLPGNTDITWSSAEVYDPGTGGWTAKASMSTPRGYQHTATLLPNGTVLVAGGSTNSEYGNSALASAEIYDPSSGTWTGAAPMNTNHTFHTATLLTNGSVLVADVNACELFDPVVGTWTLTGSMNAPRSFHGATLLPSGKLLVAGGRDSTGQDLTSSEVYDPVTGIWATNGPTTFQHVLGVQVLLPNGKVLVAGGATSGGGPTGSAEIYDPVAGTWTTNAPMSIIRYEPTGTVLASGKVLVAGGDTGSTGADLSNAELFVTSPGFIPPPPVVSLIKAVKPAFSFLVVGTNYQLQVSTDLVTWTNQGAPFPATSSNMVYSQYFDVDNWSQLFFRVTTAP